MIIDDNTVFADRLWLKAQRPEASEAELEFFSDKVSFLVITGDINLEIARNQAFDELLGGIND